MAERGHDRFLMLYLGLARNSLTNRIFDLRRGTCGLRSSALRPSPSSAPSSSSSDRCSSPPTICATACSRRSSRRPAIACGSAGRSQVSLFPSLDLVAEDVGIAQSGAAATSEMATAKSLRFGLQLSALIGGKVKMTEVTLIDPVIAVPQTQTAAKSAGMNRAASRRRIAGGRAQVAQPRQASHQERHADPAGLGRRARQTHRGAQP